MSQLLHAVSVYFLSTADPISTSYGVFIIPQKTELWPRELRSIHDWRAGEERRSLPGDNAFRRSDVVKDFVSLI
jgi:hypothetical protein